MYVTYPLQIDSSGQLKNADYASHIRQMIEQMLFTEKGERVNRPDFGCGLQQLIFDPMNDAIGLTVQPMVVAELSRWFGELIRVEDVKVTLAPMQQGQSQPMIVISIQYVLLKNGKRVTDQFSRSGGA